jgi:hypothetical protein
MTGGINGDPKKERATDVKIDSMKLGRNQHLVVGRAYTHFLKRQPTEHILFKMQYQHPIPSADCFYGISHNDGVCNTRGG